MQTKKEHTAAIVDEHILFAGSLEKLMNSFASYKVIYQAKNGSDLPQKVKTSESLPVMNGFETAQRLTEKHTQIYVLALSMEDDENIVLKTLRHGAKGYLPKDIHPDTLEETLHKVSEKGYYHSEKVTTSPLHSLNPTYIHKGIVIKEKELIFLKLACSEMTYKEIAGVMNLSPKTVDGYRHELFQKLHIKNRVGLVIYALKNDLIQL